MRKPSAKIKKSSPRKKSAKSSSLYIRYVSITFLGLLVLLGGKFLSSSLATTHVLGAAIYLARGGDGGGSSGGGDSSGSSGGSSGSSGSSSSGSENHEGSGSRGSGTSGNSKPQGTNNSISSPVSNETKVDCVGPDGKHFVTSFKGCSELNNAWKRPNFSFTLLSSSTASIGNSIPTIVPTVTPSETEKPEVKKTSGKLEVKTAKNKTKVNLETEGTEVELKSEGGKVAIKAKKTDGTEVELEKEDALDKLNEILAENDLEVGTNSANGFSIKNGETEAETHFPLSVDPVTKELTVTTPAGVKTVTVLPDQAVKNLLSKGILSSVESQAPVNESSSSASSQVTLTQINNSLAFEVNGVSNKKVLGVIPTAFAKKVFVSAETGNVLQTQETLLTRILEALSF